jgi:hypothetical protein
MKRIKKLLKRSDDYYSKEDAQILQGKLAGKSVYKSLEKLYKRTPKHRKWIFGYQD